MGIGCHPKMVATFSALVISLQTVQTGRAPSRIAVSMAVLMVTSWEASPFWRDQVWGKTVLHAHDGPAPANSLDFSHSVDSHKLCAVPCAGKVDSVDSSNGSVGPVGPSGFRCNSVTSAHFGHSARETLWMWQ